MRADALIAHLLNTATADTEMDLKWHGNLVIRPIAASDEQEWRRLWTALLRNQTTFSRFVSEGEFKPNGFIAMVNEKPVGLVQYIQHRTA
ncbi:MULTISPECIES: hypothetical protein [unclassified Mesorhizobium]|uniref:hypothetical protein n=1 Tax=unclassified Mesorhizobium TaxID=325217 RepID=UPI001FD98F5B|nr:MULTISPECIES: hypothetical protein [unclassified Mesorhizobium]